MHQGLRRLSAACIATVSVVIVCAFVFALTGPSGSEDASGQTDTTTSTLWNGGPDGLPGCIPVDSRSTSDVGCELKSDFVAASPDPNLPGVPVYDDKGPAPGEIVGYIVGGIDQFVPLSLTSDPDRLEKLKGCNQELLSKRLLDDGCVPLLEEMGTQPGFLPTVD
jgi:hypothetical protein